MGSTTELTLLADEGMPTGEGAARGEHQEEEDDNSRGTPEAVHAHGWLRSSIPT